MKIPRRVKNIFFYKALFDYSAANKRQTKCNTSIIGRDKNRAAKLDSVWNFFFFKKNIKSI